MKRLRSIALTLLLAGAALTATAQFRYGPQIGANFTTMKFKQDLVSVEQAAGPSADLACEFIFTRFGLGIDFGIGYSMTGAFVNLGDKPVWSLNGFGREHVMIHNIRIPVHIRFKWTKMQGLEDYVAPFVYGGPEFNIQAGHNRLKSNGQKAFHFSGGDVALGCGFGLEIMRNWHASFGYTWNMTYALKTKQLDDFSARIQGWNVRVAYMF